jgi:serine/threonine protein kinase
MYPRRFKEMYGSFFRARNLRFALKIIDKSKCRGTEQKIENEVAILRRLRHSNVIQLVDDFDTPDYLYMIMELITVCYMSLPSVTSDCFSLITALWNSEFATILSVEKSTM